MMPCAAAILLPIAFAKLCLTIPPIYECGHWGVRVHCGPENEAAAIEQKIPPIKGDLVDRYLRPSYIVVVN